MKKGVLAFTCLIALAAGGCFLSDEGGDLPQNGANSGKSLKIVMIPQSGTDEAQLSARSGAEKAAADIAKAQGGLKVEIDWRAPITNTADAQARVLQDAKGSNAQAVLLSCLDGDKIAKTINDVSSSVPVMTYQSDSAGSDRFSFYGLDDQEAGARLMRELARLTKDHATVAIYGGDENSAKSKKRVDGILKEAARAPGMKIVGVFHSAENAKDSSEEIKKQLLLHPDITGWILVGPWPLLNESMIKILDPSTMKIVALGCLPAELKYVQKGAVLYSDTPYQMGYVSVQAIVQKLVDKQKLPGVIRYDINAGRVGVDNVRTWARSLKTWGFEGVPNEIVYGGQKIYNPDRPTTGPDGMHTPN